MTLHELREAIDFADDALLELLANRGKLVRAAWALKQEQGQERLDVAREAQVVTRLCERGVELGLEPGDVERIWREILRVRAG
jgi:chorismate mutase